MKPITITIIIFLTLFLSGCLDRPTYWEIQYEPTTETERKAICEHVEKILSATPRELSGVDQDWDDAIAEAHKRARLTICRPTFWEYDPENYHRRTGRWKYVSEEPTRP